MMKATYKGMTMRLALPNDNAVAQAWCEADEWHEWESKQPFYWVQQKCNVMSLVFEDDRGPVLFPKIFILNPEEIEITIQFAPQLDMEIRRRTMKALKIGWDGLRKNLSAKGVKTVYFLSKNPQLIKFCRWVLGFRIDGEKFRYDIVPVEAMI